MMKVLAFVLNVPNIPNHMCTYLWDGAADEVTWNINLFHISTEISLLWRPWLSWLGSGRN